MEQPEIDWAVFDKYPENTCYCRCDAVFRSHAKSVIMPDESLQMITRSPCPNCGKNDDCWRISGDPETFMVNE